MAYRNAFEALGLDIEDATIETLRADLAGILRDWIKQRQLTQAAAGHALGVSQAVVSEIMNGQTGRKTVEYFIRLLARVGVAWTARCWHPPTDAAAVKGAAPATWIGTGGSSITRAVIEVSTNSASDFWQAVGRGGVAVSTRASDPMPVASIVVGGAEDG